MDELAVHELAETEFRKLAPEARSLDAAEGQMRRRPGGLIDEDHAAFDPFGERLAMRDIVGKDGGAEHVGRYVRKSDRRDRQGVVQGKGGSVRGELGGRRNIEKKN